MRNYRWKGINSLGEKCSGILAANSIEELKELLFKQKIALLSCKIATTNAIARNTSLIKAEFFDNLATILETGIPLISALELTQAYSHEKRTKVIITELIKQIEQGEKLSQAMRMQETYFSPLMIETTKAGEASGKLDLAFLRLSTYLEKQSTFKQQIQQASLLPIITLVFAFVIIFAVLLFVVPLLEPLLTTPEAHETIIFRISNFLQSDINKLIVIALFFVLFISIKIIGKNSFFNNNFNINKFILKLPVINNIIICENLSLFCTTLSMLLTTGNQLKQSIEIASDTCSNSIIRSYIKSIARKLESGVSFGKALEKSEKLFPEFLITSIIFGEQSGTLEKMLQKCGDLLEKKLSSRILLISTIAQPLLLLCVGVFIAFLLVSLYAPLLNVSITA